MILSVGSVSAAPAVSASSTGAVVTSTRAVPAGRFLLACKVHIANNLSASMTDSGGAHTWVNLAELNTTVSVVIWGCYTKVEIPSGSTFSLLHGVAAANGVVVMEYAGLTNDQNFIGLNFNSVAAAATVSTTALCGGGANPQAAYTGKSAALVAVAGSNNVGSMSAQAGWTNSFNTLLTGGRFNLQELVPKASLVNTEVAQANGTSSALSVAAVVIPACPEGMHEYGIDAWYRRRSGLVVRRPSVYRSRR